MGHLFKIERDRSNLSLANRQDAMESMRVFCEFFASLNLVIDSTLLALKARVGQCSLCRTRRRDLG